jgi:hypothetical protein
MDGLVARNVWLLVVGVGLIVAGSVSWRASDRSRFGLGFEAKPGPAMVVAGLLVVAVAAAKFAA